MRFCTSAALPTSSSVTLTITSPALSRFSAAAEFPSPSTIKTPFTPSLILYFLRRSSLMLARLRPSAFCTTGLSGAGASVLTEACCGVSSSRPSRTVLVSSLPLRMMTTGTSLPIGVSPTIFGRSRISLMSLPSNLMITSPGSIPAGFAGPLSSMPATSAPRVGLLRGLPKIVGDTPIGKDVPVVVIRKGKEEIKTVRLGRLEDTPQQASVKTDTPAPDKSVVQKALGLNLANMSDDLRKKYKIKDGVKGVVIVYVDANSPAAERRLSAGDGVSKVADEEVGSAADVQKRIDQLKKDGKKTALLLVANAEGDVRFVALALQ